MPLKPLFEPEELGWDERATAGYELEEYLGFCLGAALSQIPDEELDLEKSTCAGWDRNIFHIAACSRCRHGKQAEYGQGRMDFERAHGGILPWMS